MFFKPKRKGSAEEEQAAKFLQQQGIKILEQNFTCKGGEIDLIAYKNNKLHFIEVKSRKNTQFGHPSEFVTPTKQNRIIKCAKYYLLKHPHHQNNAMQFDVITLLNGKINWLKNAYSAY